MKRTQSGLGIVAGGFFGIAFILAIVGGINVGIYTLLIYGIESMTSWVCPNYWGGFILYFIGFMILKSIFAPTHSKA